LVDAAEDAVWQGLAWTAIATSEVRPRPGVFGIALHSCDDDRPTIQVKPIGELQRPARSALDQ